MSFVAAQGNSREPLTVTVRAPRRGAAARWPAAQFTSWVFGEKIRPAGLLPSFGTLGDGLGNAMMESFWSSNYASTTTTSAPPVSHDRKRNNHRSAVAWSKSAVLTNPRYKNRFRTSPATTGLPGLEIDRPGRGSATASLHVQVLLFHGSCGRRMQGTWNHERAHYRCRYPSEYAIANHLDHPPSVYLREDQLTGPLDTWLADVFHPDQLAHSLSMLEAARPDNTPALEAARRHWPPSIKNLPDTAPSWKRGQTPHLSRDGSGKSSASGNSSPHR